MHIKTAVFTILFFSTIFTTSPAASGQQIKRNPDGTVEVMDEETVYSHSTAPSTRQSTAPSRRSSRSGSGRIPAYTKHLPGVTVKRNANGTVEVTDTAMTRGSRKVESSLSKSSLSSKGSVKRIGSYKHNYSDLSVKRNADGTVEVVDTSSSSRRH
ncbi:MAG: hypothetical protein K2X27_12060 [Candidatus Obscuribacterales bacterium]|nr:hypothetical protein [Candidatus Obscuribacterales bacterium]